MKQHFMLTIHSSPERQIIPTSVQLDEGTGLHSMATIGFDNTDLSELNRYKNLPCTIVCKYATNVRTMHGYVDTVAPESEKFGKNGGALFVMGISSTMRDNTPRTWSQVKPTTVIRDVLEPYEIGFEMDTTREEISFLEQSEESDWQLLSKMAQQIGMRLVTEHAMVKFIDIAAEIRRSVGAPNIPSFWSTETKGTGIGIQSFTVISSDTITGNERYTFRGVDALGVEFSVKGGAEQNPYSKHIQRNVTSLHEALMMAERMDMRQSLNTRAVAQTFGNVRVKPGHCVKIMSSKADTATWFVDSVEHSFDRWKYDMTMNLVALGIPSGFTMKQVRRPSPVPQLVNGHWRAPSKLEILL